MDIPCFFILDVLLTRMVQIIWLLSDCDFNPVRCFLPANGADGNISFRVYKSRIFFFKEQPGEAAYACH